MAWKVVKLMFVLALGLLLGSLWICHELLQVARDVVSAMIDEILDTGFDQELSVLDDDYIGDK